jgi:hypothetical protein
MKIFISEASKQWANNLNDLRDRWRIRRESPTGSEWMPVQEFSKSILKLSRSEVIEIRTELLEILQDINHRIKTAESKVAIRRDYTDPAIYREMQQARNSVVAHLSAVEAAFARVKEQKKLSLPAAFMDVAEENLSENDFNWLLDLAERRLNGE